jgi:phosphoserine phosphatase
MLGEIVIKQKYKLAIFDMDGTLIKERTIFVIAEKMGFKHKLGKIWDAEIEPYQKSIEIAKFLIGFDSRDFLEIFRKIVFQEKTKEVIKNLRDRQIKTAIITDSYQLFADDLKKRLKIDYAFANELVTNNHIITGEIILHNSAKIPCENGRIYSICKGFILDQLCERLNIKNKETIAVGDGIVDIGMIKKAGVGIAFNAPEQVQKNADVITNDLGAVLDHI